MANRINGWNDKKEARLLGLIFTAMAGLFIPAAWWMYHAERGLPGGQHSQWISMTGMSVAHSSLVLLYWWRVFVLHRK